MHVTGIFIVQGIYISIMQFLSDSACFVLGIECPSSLFHCLSLIKAGLIPYMAFPLFLK